MARATSNMRDPATGSLSRRAMLARTTYGLGQIALSALLAEHGLLAETAGDSVTEALQPKRPHFAPRAKRVVVLFMDGGVSQVDSFDPKPRLHSENGQPFKIKIEATQFDQNGRTFASPFKFKPYGRSGLEVSELFPHMATRADDLCVIRSMHSPFAEHSQACFMMHTGHPLQGRPSLGAWLSYGLGTECADLPSYVVLNGGQLPLGGLNNFSSGFLRAVHGGSLFHVAAKSPIVDNILPAEAREALQRNKLRLIEADDREFVRDVGSGESTLESAIRNYELAFAMQRSVPHSTDISGETAATHALYGIDSKNEFEARYAQQCLLARRLLERGVRFIEVTMPGGLRFVSPWDSHSKLQEEHQKMAAVVDRPIAGLLTDLKSRGLLDDTLVIWGSEFGRTPFAQGSNGRDHNPHGFTMWLAGGGVRGGMIHGATDEYGYHAVVDRVSVHDLQATILHLLGLDHERLTYRYAGRDFRLTDVHGQLVRPILA